ncbi:MAG: CehA/McbA family metallohydrolase [Polyangiales bacterium]
MRPASFVLALALLGCSDPAPVTTVDAGAPTDDLGPNLPDALDDVPWTQPDDVPSRADHPRPPPDPRLRVFVRDGDRGEGLPCKLSLRGVRGTRDPRWGRDEQVGHWVDPDNLALGVGRWVLMARGRAAINVPPGHYRALITRGGEYSPLVFDDVEVSPTDGAELRGDLQRVVDTEGELAGEFHVHSAPSFDSDVPLDQRVLSLAVEGVEVFASTDHDALGDFAPAIRRLGLERHIHWIRGDEITADGLGHFGAMPLPPGLDPAVSLTHDEPTVTAILERARRLAPDAVIQLNHPMWNSYPIGWWSVAGFDPATGASRLALTDLFDAVEVWNSHTLDEDPAVNVEVDQVIDAWMATLQLGHVTTAMGNSDTHRLAQSPPGWPRSYLRVPTDDPARVNDAMVAGAILAGDVSLTSGPFLRMTVDGVRPGGTVSMVRERTVTVTVEVQATTATPADLVEVIVNRAVVATRRIDAPLDRGVIRQRWELPVTLTRDAWVLARTRAAMPVGEAGGAHLRPMESLALVNPVFVDTDGDGRWSAPGIGNGP